jgi:hypothetical protein
MRLSTIAALALGIASLASAAWAQGFPLMTFGQLGTIDERIAAQQKKTGARPGDLMFNPGENGGARVNAVYAGQSRPLSARNQAFIISFASSSVGNAAYAGFYEREYLFKEGGKDLWLPVQSQVAAYFAKELKVGQPVTLYVRNAGGFRLSDSWDWMFLVEEFDKPGGAPESAPVPAPKAKPGPKEIPPGPKTAV